MKSIRIHHMRDKKVPRLLSQEPEHRLTSPIKRVEQLVQKALAIDPRLPRIDVDHIPGLFEFLLDIRGVSRPFPNWVQETR